MFRLDEPGEEDLFTIGTLTKVKQMLKASEWYNQGVGGRIEPRRSHGISRLWRHYGAKIEIYEDSDEKDAERSSINAHTT